jgi:hypothetical protein
VMRKSTQKHHFSQKNLRRKMIKRNLIELKLFTHRGLTLKDFRSFDQRPLCSFCVISPEVHSRYFSIRGEFSILLSGQTKHNSPMNLRL